MSGLAAQVQRLLLARRETVATAESMTAGLVGAALTSLPGSSATFRGGLIVYATDLKATLAGVSLALLDKRGAVDPDVAIALATGVRERLAATWGLGVTGVAGPDPQDGAPVGTVHVGLAGPDLAAQVRSVTVSGGRETVRAGAVEVALTLLRDSVVDRE
jgi:nicotinamide-nucleotide amidase